ncbi:MAG: hypothetical protein ACK44G_09275 [Aphanizomenon sp.]
MTASLANYTSTGKRDKKIKSWVGKTIFPSARNKPADKFDFCSPNQMSKEIVFFLILNNN